MEIKEFKNYLKEARTSVNLSELETGTEMIDIYSNDEFLMLLSNVEVTKTDNSEDHYYDFELDFEVSDMNVFVSTKSEDHVSVTDEMLEVVEKWLNDNWNVINN